jgi:hypothetical protein
MAVLLVVILLVAIDGCFVGGHFIDGCFVGAYFIGGY